MILSYADMNNQQKKYTKRIKRAYEDTVEPPKRGHFGDGTFVLSSEVV